MMGKRLDWLHIRFRPHDWGSFFNHAVRFDKEKVSVFVPMIGDLFLISGFCFLCSKCHPVFVPMIGDLFLILNQLDQRT